MSTRLLEEAFSRNYKISKPRCYLLDSPQEIRDLIYQYVFTGAELTMEQENHRSIHSPVTHIYRNSSFCATLLRTCKQIRTEAFPVLASQTSLVVLSGVQNPNDAIARRIPPVWLSAFRVVLNNTKIRSRITHVLRQEFLDPSPFTHLRLYRVAHLVYPDWRDSCHKADDVEPFLQAHLESEFFFQAGTLRLFTRNRTYTLTVTIWTLRAFVDESDGWEVEFSLDTWSVLSKRKARFRRHKDALETLLDDPKCRDYRQYDVTFL